MPIFISPINFFLSVLFLSWQTHTHHAHKSSSLLFWIDVFLPVLIFYFYFYYTLCPNMNCKYHRTFIHSLFVFRSFENVSVANDNAMWHEFIMFEFQSLSLSFCKSDWNENLHTHTRYFSFWTEHTHTHTNFPRINNESILSYMVVVDAIDKQKSKIKAINLRKRTILFTSHILFDICRFRFFFYDFDTSFLNSVLLNMISN